MLRTITFDCWNTLIYIADPAATFAHRSDRVWRALKRQGQEVPPDLLARELSETWEYTLRQQYESGLDFPPYAHIQRLVERFQLKNEPGSFEELYRAYTEALLEEPPLMVEGAAEVLASLAGGYKLGLVCNTGSTPGTVLRQIFKRFQIDRFFNDMVFSNEVGAAKPNPVIFQRALENLDTAPENALHVGDDPVTDIRGAHDAGMRTVWFDRRNSPLTPPYDRRVRSLLEIPALLGEGKM